ncbi:MAG TPA: outer membrane protein assembly factor BamB family protein, partial [Candidatus Brocadiaceae bacterium]
MHIKNVCLTTFIFFVIFVLHQNTPLQAETPTVPWHMFRGNPQHTGLSHCKGPETNSLKWAYKIDTRITSSPSIGSDGTLYFGSIDGRLYAVNQDGNTKWAFQVGSEITASPAIGDDGTIYVGSRDKKMYAITPDGKPKWTYAIGGIILSSAAVTSDALYFGSDDNNLYALTLNGELKWKFTAKSNIVASPALCPDGSVYLFEVSGALHALTPDGVEKWSKRVG